MAFGVQDFDREWVALVPDDERGSGSRCDAAEAQRQVACRQEGNLQLLRGTAHQLLVLHDDRGRTRRSGPNEPLDRARRRRRGVDGPQAARGATRAIAERGAVDGLGRRPALEGQSRGASSVEGLEGEGEVGSEGQEPCREAWPPHRELRRRPEMDHVVARRRQRCQAPAHMPLLGLVQAVRGAAGRGDGQRAFDLEGGGGAECHLGGDGHHSGALSIGELPSVARRGIILLERPARGEGGGVGDEQPTLAEEAGMEGVRRGAPDAEARRQARCPTNARRRRCAGLRDLQRGGGGAEERRRGRGDDIAAVHLGVLGRVVHLCDDPRGLWGGLQAQSLERVLANLLQPKVPALQGCREIPENLAGGPHVRRALQQPQPHGRARCDNDHLAGLGKRGLLARQQELALEEQRGEDLQRQLGLEP
mmetsp:Transcript_84886/g.238944  ORF Transcript_84886/g.238944 Transcript_84886/m.238944 type:complete len:421 (-) Transcript_84886:809-2071(-)